VNFRTVWREKPEGPIRAAFRDSKNWPWRGLFWLSKDLFDEVFRDLMEPDARELYEIRNHLEHRYLKIHEMLSPRTGNRIVDSFADNLAHSILRTDFEAKTLRLLKLSRAALIYLSLGMHQEERQRAKERGDAFLMPMDLSPWDDKWKV
jgi:LA2681-like HEPN